MSGLIHEPLVVKYADDQRNNFVHLPHHVIVKHFQEAIDQRGSTCQVLQLKWISTMGSGSQSDGGERNAFVAWSWGVSAQSDAIEVPHALATNLGLHELDKVHVKIVEKAKQCIQCDRVMCRPCDANDSQILELNQSDIEQHCLNQSKVLYRGLVFPVWTNNSMVVANLEVVNFETREGWSKLGDEDSRPIILDDSTELVVQPIGHTARDGDAPDALMSHTRDIIHRMKLASMQSCVKNIDTEHDLVRKYQRCAIVTEKFASMHGFQDGDIVQLFHNVIIRIEKTEQQKLQEQQQQQQKKQNLEQAMAKDFEEKKERRWTFARLRVAPSTSLTALHHRSLKDKDEETQLLIDIAGNNDESDIVVHDNLIMELGTMEKSTVFLKYVATSGSKKLTGMGSVISSINIKQVTPHPRHTPAKTMPPLLSDAGDKIGRSVLKKWCTEQSRLATAPEQEFFIPLGQRNVISMRHMGKQLTFLISFNEGVFPHPDGMKSQDDAVEFGWFLEEQEQPAEKNLFLLGPNEVEKHVVNVMKGCCSIKIKEPVHWTLPMTMDHPNIDNNDNGDSGNVWKEQLRYKSKKSSSIHNAMQQLTSIFMRGSFVHPGIGNVVISGQSGMGATTFAKMLATRFDCLLDLHNSSAKVDIPYVVHVQCATMAGDRTDTQIEKLRSYLMEALTHNPSIVILDNLDAICPMEQEEVMPDPNTRVLSSVILDLMATIQRASKQPLTQSYPKCCFIATCNSFDITMNKIIQNSNLFDIAISLQLPDSNERRQLIRAMMTKRECGGSVSNKFVEHIVKESEGFSPRDLHLIFEKLQRHKIIQSMKAGMQRFHRHQHISPSISRNTESWSIEDFDAVRKDFQISSTEGIKLVKDSPIKWNDVGGLHDVKKILRETFEFPTKFAKLFKHSPIKLRQGLLLYGPPGCGKTMLASAVAKECGLGFISVKGPELLNKYIGQSEHQVRQLFEQAQQAAPCIVFFDEFESLAAKRGHDNTGVTDRVVNQLLTQLDGVEERRGVYVLAATSRPDLVDAALLRPGRLDKCLKCGFPTLVERIDILKKASMNYDINIGETEEQIENVWREMAMACEYFSGADLQGFISTANLIAVHDYLDKRNKSEPDSLLDNFLDGDMDEQVAQDDHALPSTPRFSIANKKQLMQTTSLASSSNKGKGKMRNTEREAEEQEAMQQDVAQMITHLEQMKLAQSRTKRQNQDGDSAAAAAAAKQERGSDVVITVRHLREALKSSRPSLGMEERAYFDYVYETFQSAREGGAQQHLQQILKQQMKATLA